MAKRLGSNTIQCETRPRILASAGVAGKREAAGPLGARFDRIFDDTAMDEDSWEKAESRLLLCAAEIALEKAKLEPRAIQAVFAGDLQSQCTASVFGLRGLGVPYAGIFGACSTMAEGLLLAALAIESGGFSLTMAATASHFCTAERQFRHPLEYGGQRTPTAQWTVTGAGAALLAKEADPNAPLIDKVQLGTMVDLGVTDAGNMGAAMAPAAKKTIADFLRDTNTTPDDYDLILTGDLGAVGSDLLHELMRREEGIDLEKNHRDCGVLIYDRETQDVHSGGSGCGCSASVLCCDMIRCLREGSLSNILFVATGALMSATSSKQGESIPGIAHAVLLKRGEG